MRFTIAIFLVTLSATFQAAASTWPDACGKDSIQFKVKTSKAQAELVAPETGKALIIFTENVSGEFGSAPIARFGIDGSWAGANKGASYFAVSVAPGEHHLCAVRQSGAKSDKVNVGEATVNAEAGNVYYYDFKITRTPIGSPRENGGGGLPGAPHDMTARVADTIDSVAFTSLDEKEGKQRIGLTPQSTSTAKQ